MTDTYNGKEDADYREKDYALLKLWEKSNEKRAPQIVQSIKVRIRDREKPIIEAWDDENSQDRYYDRINLTMPKGKKELIKAAADALGVSVNTFINQAIDEKMQQ